jgi:hypothetical protein
MLIFHVKKSDLKDMFLVVTWTKMRFFCRFETPSEIPANYLAGNFSELYGEIVVFLHQDNLHLIPLLGEGSGSRGIPVGRPGGRSLPQAHGN